MASLAWDRRTNGTRRARVLFMVDGERRSIRLGTVPPRTADDWRRRIEELVALRLTGSTMPVDLASWVGSLPAASHDKLLRAGLVAERATIEAVTLGKLLTAWTERGDVKPSTRAAYKQTADSLRSFFGDNRELSSIHTTDADRWRSWIATSTTSTTRKRGTADNRLSPATVAKRVFVARAVFRRAVRWGWLDKSPFDDMKAGTQANPARSVYVPRAVVADVIEACSSIDWRVVVALARYAGLRCPSEVGAVTFDDIDWHHGRLTVRASKTEGHEGHALRFVPIDPELRAVLAEAFDAAPEGQTHVAPLAARGGANLRTTLEKVIVRAGHKPWPRLLQNLRASCATDWVERYPNHVVAKWLGHSPMIAATHYLQSREHHFDDAVRGGAIEAQGGAQKAAHQGGKKAAQQGFATCRSTSPETPKSTEKDAENSVFPADSGDFKVGDIGTELPAFLPGKRGIVGEGGQKSGALPADLALVVETWPTLPDDAKRRIVGIVKAARDRAAGGRRGR